MPAELRAYASLPHYWEHLSPIVEALQTATTQPLRGVHAPQGRWWGDPLPTDRRGAVWLVAGAADAKRLGAGVPLVYVEHGAGQSYPADPRSAGAMSYSGGAGLDDVVLFICPNEQVAARWHARYPSAALAVAGCPKLDRWHARDLSRGEVTSGALQEGEAPATEALWPAKDRGLPEPEEHDDGEHDEQDHRDVGAGEREHGSGRTRRRVVAVAFHWPNTLCSESQWALPHYRSALPRLRDELAAADVELVGHGHPRAWRQLRREWHRLGVRPIDSLARVFDEADLLVVDNSSAGPEFASLGRPIVWLSAPWYRRDVQHGGRFWDWTVGVPHVEEPDELASTVLATLAEGLGEGHARLVEAVYSHTDGNAARRAADAILEVSDRWPSAP